MTDDVLTRAKLMLQQEFGPAWESIAQTLGTENLRHRVGKNLTSFVAYPERGSGGDNRWRGNCSPEIVRQVAQYVLENKAYQRKDTSSFTLLDPMSGSGTSGKVAEVLGIRSVLYDLNPSPPAGLGGWNALRDDVNDSADIIFFHPPYHNIIRYSGAVWGNSPHPDDLSQCENYSDFIDKLNFVIKKLFLSLRKDGRLAILVGDVRSGGRFYPMQQDLIQMGEKEAFIVKAQFNCQSDTRTYAKPFVPVVTEYLLLFRKDESLIIPVSWQKRGVIDLRNMDSTALTWNHLIRMTMEQMGGRAKLTDLYSALEQHPKGQRNVHYRERVRATIYENQNQYINCGNGEYSLNYAAA